MDDRQTDLPGMTFAPSRRWSTHLTRRWSNAQLGLMGSACADVCINMYVCVDIYIYKPALKNIWLLVILKYYSKISDNPNHGPGVCIYIYHILHVCIHPWIFLRHRQSITAITRAPNQPSTFLVAFHLVLLIHSRV